MRTRSALAALGFLLVSAGCGSDDGLGTPTAPPPPDPPPAPGPPPPPPPHPPPPPPDRIVLRPDGVFHAPHQVTELTPGTAVQIQVVARPPTFYLNEPEHFAPAPDWAAFTVQTEAPPSVLQVRRWIQRREAEGAFSNTGEMETRTIRVGIVEVQAIEVGAREHAQAIHEVWIGTPAGGFPGPFEIEVDSNPLRFRVVPPSPAVPCEELGLTVRSNRRPQEPGQFFRRLFEDADEVYSGRITVRAPGFGVGLRLLAPYRFRGGELTDAPWNPSAQRQTDEVGFPFLFAAGMNLRPVGEGFEQTFDLGWFDELEVLAHAPGCEPRRIRCDTRGSCSSD